MVLNKGNKMVWMLVLLFKNGKEFAAEIIGLARS